MGLFSRHPSDDEIIAGIRAGGTQRRLFENKLYVKFAYLVAEGERKHRLSEDECETAYSDAFMTVVENIVSGRFEERSGLKTYIYQIFSFKCVDIIRKKTTNRSKPNEDAFSLDDSLLQLPDAARSVLQNMSLEDEIEELHRHLRELGEKCRAMILANGEGYSDDEIALTMGYNSAAVAKTSRLRCLEKLRERYRDR